MRRLLRLHSVAQNTRGDPLRGGGGRGAGAAAAAHVREAKERSWLAFFDFELLRSTGPDYPFYLLFDYSRAVLCCCFGIFIVLTTFYLFLCKA